MKRILTIITLLLTILVPFNVLSENDRIVDKALMLSENERSELTNELDAISDKYDMDVVVYFSTDTSFGDNDNSIMIEGGEFFDGNGYGYGDDHRGILLIVNYATGYLDIITTGPQVMEKYDGYIEEAYDYISPYLRDNPAEAIRVFIKWVDTRFIPENNNNNSDNNYDDYTNNDYYPSEDTDYKKDTTVRDLSVSGIFSLIISSVTMLIFKKQLKTEGKKADARNYVVPNSFKLTRSGDIFLYRSTMRRRIQRNDSNRHSSGGGGGHHVSFSSSHGISHGSGGGHKF